MSLLSDYLNERGVICVAITEEDYHGEHKAPSTDDAPLYDLSVVYPNDIYTGRGSDYAQEPSERYGLAEVLRCHNKPWARVQVFRAVPKDIKGAKINPGDWVTLSRQYAKEHGLRSLGGPGKYKILTLNAYARDLYTNGDSLAEWGYNPRPATAEEDAKLSSLRKAKALDQIKRASAGEKIIGINAYPEEPYYGKSNEFFANLLAQRQATASEEIPDTIEVGGKQRPTTTEINAMAAPSEQHKSLVLYHGTYKEDLALNIIKCGYLQGRLVQGRALQAPVKGYVYATKNVLYAAGYAGVWINFGMGTLKSRRQGLDKFTGYVFVVDASKAEDIIVDEDVLGEVATSWENYMHLSKGLLTYLQNIAASCATPRQLEKAKDGMFIYQSAIGKKMQKAIPEQKMRELIDICPHLALKNKEQRMPILGYYTINKVISTKEEFFANAVYHKYEKKQLVTSATNYQDDTEYAPGQAELTKLGLIFGQPQSKNDGIRVTYKGHTLEIRPDKKEIELSPAVPASRGRKYVPASVKNVPGYAVTGITHKGSVTNVLRAEDAEKWLRGLKAYWDRRQ